MSDTLALTKKRTQTPKTQTQTPNVLSIGLGVSACGLGVLFWPHIIRGAWTLDSVYFCGWDFAVSIHRPPQPLRFILLCS